MKMIIATDSAGQILGAVQGHSLSEKQGDMEVNVAFPSGHVLHQVEVDDDIVAITDPAEFQRRLMQHLPKT